METLFINLMGCMAAYLVAKSRERSAWWFLLSWIGFVIVLALPSLKKDPEAPSADTHVRCPDCKELGSPRCKKIQALWLCIKLCQPKLNVQRPISMKQPALFILLSGLLLPTLSNADNQADSPFGVKIGMNKEALKRITTDKINANGFQHISISPPKPNEIFDLYTVLFTNETGVCAVLATATSIKSDQKATLLIIKYQNILGILSKKYGDPYAQENTFDSSSDYNLYRLSKNEIGMESYWNKAGKFSSIILSIGSSDGTTGNINLFYYGENFKKCKEVRENEISNTL